MSVIETPPAVHTLDFHQTISTIIEVREEEVTLIEATLAKSETNEVNGYGAVLLLRQAGAGEDVIQVAESALEGEANALGVSIAVRSYLRELEEAQEPSTSKGRLETLLKSKHARVREAVRSNPGARNLVMR